MKFKYFYGNEARHFAFYQIPKALFTDEHFRGISPEAKIIYSLLLDRMSLSVKNGRTDADGKVYIVYTISEVMDDLGCGDKKAVKILRELEAVGLIERIRRGLGKANRIYVKNFIADEDESQFLNRQNDDSAIVKTTIHESSKQRSNNTNKNNTDMSKTDSYRFASESEAKGSESANEYEKQIDENICFDKLKAEQPEDEALIDEVRELIIDTVRCSCQTMRICGDDKPTEKVRERLLNLRPEHIRLVLDGFNKNTTPVRNIKQYLLAALYNAPMTLESHNRNAAKSKNGAASKPQYRRKNPALNYRQRSYTAEQFRKMGVDLGEDVYENLGDERETG